MYTPVSMCRSSSASTTPSARPTTTADMMMEDVRQKEDASEEEDTFRDNALLLGWVGPKCPIHLKTITMPKIGKTFPKKISGGGINPPSPVPASVNSLDNSNPKICVTENQSESPTDKTVKPIQIEKDKRDSEINKNK